MERKINVSKPPFLKQIRAAAQHAFNPLHVYCRLRDVGVSRTTARYLSFRYEKYLYKNALG